MARNSDPTEAMRLAASRYPDVDEGTACTQSAFKTNKKAFLYVGMQGGRYKAMFKLDASLPEARRLAEESPADYQVGTGGWVTARFSAGRPIPQRRWKTWLDESHARCLPPAKARVPVKKQSAGKKATAKRRSPKARSRRGA